jgi:hypothetical protein
MTPAGPRFEIKVNGMVRTHRQRRMAAVRNFCVTLHRTQLLHQDRVTRCHVTRRAKSSNRLRPISIPSAVSAFSHILSPARSGDPCGAFFHLTANSRRLPDKPSGRFMIRSRNRVVKRHPEVTGDGWPKGQLADCRATEKIRVAVRDYSSPGRFSSHANLSRRHSEPPGFFHCAGASDPQPHPRGEAAPGGRLVGGLLPRATRSRCRYSLPLPSPPARMPPLARIRPAGQHPI